MATGKFHSALFSNFPAPGQASAGDIWFDTISGNTFWADNSGNLHQLLEQSPYPTIGPAGPTGPAGQAGQNFIGTTAFYGNWSMSPVSYQAGAIVSWNGFLYISLAPLNISLNVENPEGNPFWRVLGPSTFAGQSSELVLLCDGAGQTPTNGFKGFVTVPYACQTTGWVLLGDQSGSASFDIKWSTYANLPSTFSIVSGVGPFLTSQQKNEGNTSGWSKTNFSAGDVLEFDLLSAAGSVQFLSLVIQISAT